MALFAATFNFMPYYTVAWVTFRVDLLSIIS